MTQKGNTMQHIQNTNASTADVVTAICKVETLFGIGKVETLFGTGGRKSIKGGIM